MRSFFFPPTPKKAPCPAGRNLVDLVNLCASQNEPIAAAGGIIYEIYKISQAQATQENQYALPWRAEIS
jgi:hypothetical protein